MDWLSFIRGQIRAQTYEISLHADDERFAEHLTVVEIETALMSGEILEEYPEDPRGPSCLSLGFTHEGRPCSCGVWAKQSRSARVDHRIRAHDAEMA